MTERNAKHFVADSSLSETCEKAWTVIYKRYMHEATMRRSSLVSLTFLFLVSSWRAHPLFPRITRRNAYDSRHTREMQQRIRHDAMRRRQQRMQPELQCHFGECVCSLMLRCTHGDFNRCE